MVRAPFSVSIPLNLFLLTNSAIIFFLRFSQLKIGDDFFFYFHFIQTVNETRYTSMHFSEKFKYFLKKEKIYPFGFFFLSFTYFFTARQFIVNVWKNMTVFMLKKNLLLNS